MAYRNVPLNRRRRRISNEKNMSNRNNVVQLRPDLAGRRAVSVSRTRKQPKIKANSFDFALFFVVLSLIMFGIVMVFSSSYYYALTRASFDNNKYYFVIRQAIWSGLGLVAMTFMLNFPYRFIRKFTWLAYLFTLVCLVLVLLVGSEVNGSRRWLGIPNSSLGFQPSEVAKIVIILHLSNFIASNKNILATLNGFIQCCAILLVPVVLIAAQNLSTAIVVAGIGACIMFIASPKIWYFVVGVIFAAGGVGLALILPQFKYRVDRITYWLDPFSDPTNKGFQIIQSLYAVASGGLFGLGLGQSRQKAYVPEPYNDIIFAIICEELGMVGAAIVILLFAVLVWRGIKIAMNAQDMFGCLTAMGIVALIGIQVIINISVATNTVPNTGMQLPFISFGGSGMIFTLTAMGILLNISRYQKNRE